ncbi:MAG: competence/damage-inducible protein A [Eubacterium sp.]
MNCELISVGTELLTGDTLNTNVSFLAKELSVNGFSVLYQTIVGDNPKRLKEVMTLALKRCDLIITTGGLGPTQDDLTKETIAELFEMTMERKPEIVDELKSFFERRGSAMTENNLRQADVPKGAIMLKNPRGTAPGIMIKKDDKIVIMLPGPPHEMKGMYLDEVESILQKISNQLVISRYYMLSDMGESAVEDAILDLIDDQVNPTIATYAKLGEVMIRLTANGNNEDEINALLDHYEKIIIDRFGSHIFTHSQDSLDVTVGRLLMEKGLTIALAESCTGGLVSAKLAEIPGISAALKMGLVTYSNEAKRQLLYVNEKTLEEHGAVSEETAREMCENLQLISNCDITASITGIAGPDGGSEKKPVGLVYVGVCYHGKTTIMKYQFEGSRKIIQIRTVNKVFHLIRQAILDKESDVFYNSK